MQRRTRLLFITLTLLLTAASATAQNRQVEPIAFTSFDIPNWRGRAVSAERGTLTVPENRADPSSQMITLAVVRLKSKATNPGTPVVYLAGGPGGSAIAATGFLYRLFERVLDNHDLILMDQRGTGQSRPWVVWASPTSLPADFFVSEEKALDYARRANEAARASFEERGIDLRGYNSVESADDLNDLRQAIEADTISLLGFSYGTHLALATIRRHADYLDSVVLVGTEGPNHTLKLPSTYDAQLRTLSDLAAEDPTVGNKVPDMVALLERILARLEKDPLTVTIQDQRTKDNVDIPVGKFGLQLIVRWDVGDGNDFPEFPALFYSIDKGDDSLLRKYVAKRYYQLGRGILGMSVMMDLYSGATAERLEQIERETPPSILGSAVNFSDMFIADIWGNPDLGDAYRSPLNTDTRTLFVSGTLDSNTPPHQAEDVRQGFSKSQHLIVEYAGHEDMLPHAGVQQAIVDFLNGKEISTTALSLGKPTFLPISSDDLVAKPGLPLPNDIAITPPAPDVPENLAAFSGTWRGVWGSTLDFMLIVTEVDAEKAEVIYSNGDAPSWNVERGFVQRTATILPGDNPSLQWGDTSQFTFTLGEDPDVVHVSLKVNGADLSQAIATRMKE